jgi:ribosome-binding protein aMBF1 (putative translation factor)
MARRKTTLLDELHGEIAANPVMDEVYQQELARLKLANQILTARQRAGLTQGQLAQRIGTHQAGVARLESERGGSCNLSTLAKIAVATGGRLEVRLVPPSKRAIARSR